VPKPFDVVLLHKLVGDPLLIFLVQRSSLVLNKLSLVWGADLILHLGVGILVDDLLSSLDVDWVLFDKVLLILKQLNLHLFVGLVSNLVLDALIVAATEIAAGFLYAKITRCRQTRERLQLGVFVLTVWGNLCFEILLGIYCQVCLFNEEFLLLRVIFNQCRLDRRMISLAWV